MRTEASGEQAVAVRHLDDVIGCRTARHVRSRHQVGPAFNVPPGVADDRDLARSA